MQDFFANCFKPIGGGVLSRFLAVFTAILPLLVARLYQMNDSLGYTLEAAFHDVLRDQSGLRLIREVPIILGTSGAPGTTDGSYDLGISEAAVELAWKLLASA